MGKTVSDDVLLPMNVEERHVVQDLHNSMVDVEEWEKVVTRAVTGVAQSLKFDKDTMGILKGRCVSFDIRKDRVIIGRSTQKHRVDVNLTYEGPTVHISRRQAVLKIEPAGRCLLYNIGQASMFVDKKPVNKGEHAEVHHNSMIEVGLLRLLFFRNEDVLHFREQDGKPTVHHMEPSLTKAKPEEKPQRPGTSTGPRPAPR